MTQLTDDEIRFVKETRFTPTVYQCGQYYMTSYTDERVALGDDYAARVAEYEKKWYGVAEKDAKERYGVDLGAFLEKSDADDSDVISLEYAATYLLYCFFTKSELERLTNDEAIRFLQNYKYYGGFRKWDYDCSLYIKEAIDAHDGLRVFYIEEDGNVCNAEVNAQWLNDKRYRILKI